MAALTFQGLHAYLDGELAHGGTTAEGLLVNARLVQAVADFSDRIGSWDAEANTDAFIAAMDTWKAHGLNAFTFNFQGGLAHRDWQENYNNSAWTSTGTLKAAYASRITRVLDAAVARDIVPIVGLFYFRQDQILPSENVIRTAVNNAITFLQPWKPQIVVEVINEANHGRVSHSILQKDRAGELVEVLVNAGYYATFSTVANTMPSVSEGQHNTVILLHGNDRTTQEIRDMVLNARNRFPGKPVLYNEDGPTGRTYTDSEFVAHLDAAIVDVAAGWGYYDQDGFQTPPLGGTNINWGLNTSRKNLIFDRFATHTATTGEPEPPPPDTTEGAWLEADRKVVFEVESVAPVGDWVLESSDAGHTGSGYFTNRGSDAMGDGGQSVLTWTVKITNPGPYFIAIHSRRQDSGAGDANNDCWVKVDNGSWIKHFQRAGIGGTTPAGSTASHEVWRWAERMEITHGNNVDPVFNLTAGYHTFRISKRSTRYSIDRVHMFSVASGTPTFSDNPPLAEPVSVQETDGEEPEPEPTPLTPPSLTTVSPFLAPFGGQSITVPVDQRTPHMLVSVGYDAAGGDRISTGESSIDGYFDLSVGGGGGGTTQDGYVDLGNIGEHVSADDHADFDSADLDVAVLVEPTSWTPAANLSLIRKWVTSGNQRSFILQLLQAGTLQLVWSSDGATPVQSKTSTALGFADGVRKWIRFTFESATNTVSFFESDDGNTWTAVGTPSSGTAGIFAGTAPVELGSPDSAPVEKVLAAEWRTSVDGTVVADPDFRDGTQTSDGGATFVDSHSKTWTLEGGASWSPPITSGDSGAYVSTPDHSSFVPAGDVVGDDFSGYVEVALDSWTPGSDLVLLQQWGSAGNRSFRFGVTAAGTLFLERSLDGTASETVTGTSLPFAGGVRRWVAFEYFIAGGVIFSSSEDGANWTHRGQAEFTAGGTFFDSTDSLLLGDRAVAVPARMFQAELTVSGAAVADPDFTTLDQKQNGSFLDSHGRTWTPGGGAAYVEPGGGTGGIFFQGQPLARLQGDSWLGESEEWWYLQSPPQGQGDLEIAFGIGVSKVIGTVYQIAGSAGIIDQATAAGEGSSPTVAAAVPAGTLVVGDHVALADGFPSEPASNWTETWDERTGTDASDLAGAGARRTTVDARTVTYAATLAAAGPWQAGVVAFGGTEGSTILAVAVGPTVNHGAATPTVTGQAPTDVGNVYGSVYGSTYQTAVTATGAVVSHGVATPTVGFLVSAAGAVISAGFATPRLIGAPIPTPVPRPVTYSAVVVARIPRSVTSPTFVDVGPLTGWSGLSWEEMLNGEAQATVTVDPHAQPPAVASRLANLLDASELWIYRDGVVVFAGPIVGIQPQSSDAGLVSTLHVRSLWHYPRRWWVEPTRTLSFPNTDQFSIVRGLINYYQGLAHGDVGIDVATDTSGVLRDRTYAGPDNHNIGQRIEELAALSVDGFDFRVDPATRTLMLGFPELGTDKTATVVLDRRNIVDPGAMMSVGPEDVASEAYTVSPQQGEDVAALVSHRHNDEIRQRWGRTGAFAAVNDITSQSTLDGHSDRVLADRDEMFYQPGPELIPVSGADVDDFTVGDRIEMSYDYGFSTLITQRRVVRRRIGVTSTGDETISVELNVGTQSTVKALRDLQRRVSELEART